MNSIWPILVTRAASALACGALLGLYFDHLFLGLFLAALVVVIIHSIHIYRLEGALAKRERIDVPDGTGAWARLLARVSYLNLRIARHKKNFRMLLKEVRNSTNAMPDGVVSLNEQFDILRFNRSARSLLGLKKRRDRGQRIDNLVRMPDFVAYLAERDFSEALMVASPVEDDTWLSLRVVPYGAGLWLLLVRDVTEQTVLARMRRDFVANASHELRTPLTVISGYLDALAEDENKPEFWARPLQEMATQSDRMMKIVAGLLELSRMETSDFAVDHDWVDLPALIKSEVQTFANNPDQASIELSLESQKGVVGLATALESVVSNLLQNAVRYTPGSGAITISWRELANGQAVLSVKDNGEGIAESDLPRVTERFFRANRGRSRSHGGTGLGLAIVKHALKLHDATLEIDSELAVGSEFQCYFPAARVRAATEYSAASL